MMFRKIFLLSILIFSFSYAVDEINRIIEELLKSTTIQDLSEKINKIFKDTYNGLYQIEKNEEIEIAKKIFEECNNKS